MTAVLVLLAVAICIGGFDSIATSRRLTGLEKKIMTLPADVAAQITQLQNDLTAAAAKEQADALTIATQKGLIDGAAAAQVAALAAQAAEFQAALAPAVTQADALANQTPAAPANDPTPPPVAA